MKTRWLPLFFFAGAWCAGAARAAPVRVALLDFENQAAAPAESGLGGIAPAGLAQQGAFALGRQLAGGDFTLIDRREFIEQLTRSRPADEGRGAAARVSFLRAAQALNADLVLRGTLQALSTSRETVHLAGQKTEQVVLSLRVGLEALDTTDGAVLGLAGGVAQRKFRQTDAQQTTLGEEELIGLLDEAVRAALVELRPTMTAWARARAERPRVLVSIRTDADPALVELDGVLIGATPLEKFGVYRGDHLLAIGKPGYREMAKRINVEQNLDITVPMLRQELSAGEMKEILEKVRLNIHIGEPALRLVPFE